MPDIERPRPTFGSARVENLKWKGPNLVLDSHDSSLLALESARARRLAKCGNVYAGQILDEGYWTYW